MEHCMGDYISKARQNRKMTQEEFASRLGVTAAAVSKWERGLGLPDISLLPGICQILNLDANMLLGIEKNSVVENHDSWMNEEIKGNLFAEPLAIEFGSGLVPLFAEGLKTDFVNRKRKELAEETGMLLPLLRIRDNCRLPEKEFYILSYGRVLYKTKVEGMDEDTYRQLISRVIEECKQNYASILNKQIVKTMVDTIKEYYPGIADGLVPEKISYLELERRLKEKLKESGNIRDMIHILEQMEEER